MRQEDCQTLCEAIDALADARANLAVIKYRLQKREIRGDAPELGVAVEMVTQCQDELQRAIRRIGPKNAPRGATPGD